MPNENETLDAARRAVADDNLSEAKQRASAKSHDARELAVAKYRSERQTQCSDRLAELERMKAHEVSDCDNDIALIKSVAEIAADDASETIAGEAMSLFEHAVEHFGQAPRTSAEQVVATIKRFAPRVLVELGDTMSHALLLAAFAPNDARVGSDDFRSARFRNSATEIATQIIKAALDGSGVATVQLRLLELEASVAETLKKCSPDAERAAVVRSQAGTRRLTRALQDLDTARAKGTIHVPTPEEHDAADAEFARIARERRGESVESIDLVDRMRRSDGPIPSDVDIQRARARDNGIDLDALDEDA